MIIYYGLSNIDLLIHFFIMVEYFNYELYLFINLELFIKLNINPTYSEFVMMCFYHLFISINLQIDFFTILLIIQFYQYYQN